MKVRVTSEFTFSKKYLTRVMTKIKLFPAKAVIGCKGRGFGGGVEGQSQVPSASTEKKQIYF